MQKPIIQMMIELGQIRDALLNVPVVGEVYDQQHSDCQFRAYNTAKQLINDLNALLLDLNALRITLEKIKLSGIVPE